MLGCILALGRTSRLSSRLWYSMGFLVSIFTVGINSTSFTWPVCVCAGDYSESPRSDQRRLRSGAGLPHGPHCLQVPRAAGEDRPSQRQEDRRQPGQCQVGRRGHRRDGAAEADVRRDLCRVRSARPLCRARHASDGGRRRHQVGEETRGWPGQGYQGGPEGCRKEGQVTTGPPAWQHGMKTFLFHSSFLDH